MKLRSYQSSPAEKSSPQPGQRYSEPQMGYVISSLHNKLLNLEQKYVSFVDRCANMLQESQNNLSGKLSFQDSSEEPSGYDLFKELSEERKKLDEDLNNLLLTRNGPQGPALPKDLFRRISEAVEQCEEEVCEYLEYSCLSPVKKSFYEMQSRIWNILSTKRGSEEATWIRELRMLESQKSILDTQREEYSQKYNKNLHEKKSKYKDLLDKCTQEKNSLQEKLKQVKSELSKKKTEASKLEEKCRSIQKKFENKREENLTLVKDLFKANNQISSLQRRISVQYSPVKTSRPCSQQYKSSPRSPSSDNNRKLKSTLIQLEKLKQERDELLVWKQNYQKTDRERQKLQIKLANLQKKVSNLNQNIRLLLDESLKSEKTKNFNHSYDFHKAQTLKSLKEIEQDSPYQSSKGFWTSRVSSPKSPTELYRLEQMLQHERMSSEMYSETLELKTHELENLKVSVSQLLNDSYDYFFYKFSELKNSANSKLFEYKEKIRTLSGNIEVLQKNSEEKAIRDHKRQEFIKSTNEELIETKYQRDRLNDKLETMQQSLQDLEDLQSHVKFLEKRNQELNFQNKTKQEELEQAFQSSQESVETLQNQKTELENKTQQLNNELGNITEELRSSQARNSELQTELKQLQSEYENIEKSLQAFKCSYMDKQSEYDELVLSYENEIFELSLCLSNIAQKKHADYNSENLNELQNLFFENEKYWKDQLEHMTLELNQLKQQNNNLNSKTQELKKLTAENSNLKEELNSVTQKLSELQTQSSFYESKLKETEPTIDRLESQLRVQIGQNKELSSQNQQLQNHYLEVCNDLTGSQNKVNELETQNQRLQESYSEVCAELNESQKAISELKTQNEEFQKLYFKDLTENKRILENQLEDLQKQYSEVCRDLTESQNKVNELETQNKELQKQYSEVCRDLTDSQNKVNELETQNKELQKQYSEVCRDLTESKSNLETQIDELQKQYSKVCNDLTDTQSKVKELETQNQDFQEQYSKTSNELNENQHKITTLETQNQELRTQLDKANSAIQKLETKIQEIQKTNNSLITEKNNLLNLQQENQKLSQEITYLKGSNTQLQNTIQELKDQQETKKADESMQNQLEEKQEHIEKLKSTLSLTTQNYETQRQNLLDETNQQVEQLTQKVRFFELTNEELKEDTKTLETQLAVARERNQALKKQLEASEKLKQELEKHSLAHSTESTNQKPLIVSEFEPEIEEITNLLSNLNFYKDTNGIELIKKFATDVESTFKHIEGTSINEVFKQVTEEKLNLEQENQQLLKIKEELTQEVRTKKQKIDSVSKQNLILKSSLESAKSRENLDDDTPRSITAKLLLKVQVHNNVWVLIKYHETGSYEWQPLNNVTFEGANEMPLENLDKLKQKLNLQDNGTITQKVTEMLESEEKRSIEELSFGAEEMKESSGMGDLDISSVMVEEKSSEKVKELQDKLTERESKLEQKRRTIKQQRAELDFLKQEIRQLQENLKVAKSINLDYIKELFRNVLVMLPVLSTEGETALELLIRVLEFNSDEKQEIENMRKDKKPKKIFGFLRKD